MCSKNIFASGLWSINGSSVCARCDIGKYSVKDSGATLGAILNFLVTIAGALAVSCAFGWKLALATNEHGLLSVQKSPIKIDGPKGQRVVRSRDKIGPETTSSEEPQILIEFPPL